MLRKAFAKTLKNLRLERKISQTELSRLADLNRTYLSLLERGHRSPSLNTVKKLAEVFKINPSELMTLVETHEELGGKEIQEDLIASGLLSAEMGTWMVNVKTGQFFHGSWWTEHLGYAEGDESYTIESFMSLIYPEDIKRLELSYVQHLTGILPYHEVQYRIRTKDGVWKKIWCRGKVIKRDEAGGPEFMSGVHLDISEMDLKILERKEIEGMRICGSKLAHEINNPLSIVKGNLQIIQQTTVDQNIMVHLDRMEIAIDRIASIVMRMNEGTSLAPLPREGQSLSMVLDLALRRSLGKIGETQFVSVDKRYDQTELQVRGDAEDLIRIFMEILKNAFEANKPGQAVEVVIEARKEDSFAVITIEDNGVGIPAENLPFICDMFYTTKDTHSYLGLGLSTSRCLIYRLGGTMEIHSTPSAGTKITVYLPLFT